MTASPGTTESSDRLESAGTDSTGPSIQPETTRYLMLWGLTVWVAVFALVRVAGHVLLSPSTPLVLAGVFVSVVPLMGAVTYPVYRWLDVAPAARPAAAALMSLPGMFLDVVLVVSADAVFPRMSPEMVVQFGAILLFGYGVVLLTGFVPHRR